MKLKTVYYVVIFNFMVGNRNSIRGFVRPSVCWLVHHAIFFHGKKRKNDTWLTNPRALAISRHHQHHYQHHKHHRHHYHQHHPITTTNTTTSAPPSTQPTPLLPQGCHQQGMKLNTYACARAFVHVHTHAHAHMCSICNNWLRAGLV